MPLTRRVTFRALLQGGNRVQVPKLIRWEFKMATDQTLNVGLHCLSTWSGYQSFFARMGKDGRIFIPKLVLASFRTPEKQDLRHCLFEVSIEPL
jgi:hypothetical protein